MIDLGRTTITTDIAITSDAAPLVREFDGGFR